MNRAEELQAFKKIDITLILAAAGYRYVANKSSHASALMVHESGEKLICAKNARSGDYVFCSITDPDKDHSGTAIDLVQAYLMPGASLPQVREYLRPFLNIGYGTTQLRPPAPHLYAPNLKASKTNFLAVQSRYEDMEPIGLFDPYLCDTRGIPTPLLQHPRISDRIRRCKRTGSIIFPHWGLDEGERILKGYEIKTPGQAGNFFSKSGRKSLFISRGFEHDTELAVFESSLDGLSYLALHDPDTTRIASISGKMNDEQPALLSRAIQRMPNGSTIIAGFDNDPDGHQLAERLAAIVTETKREDLEFRIAHPDQPGMDWNEALCQSNASQTFQSEPPTLSPEPQS